MLIVSDIEFKKFSDLSPLPIYILQDDKLKLVNPQMLQLTGYTQEEILALPFHQLIHPEDRSRVIDTALRRLKGEAVPESYEFRIIHKYGRVIHLNCTSFLITFLDRPAVLGQIVDISKLKQTEALLQQTEAQLSHSETRYRHLLDNISDIVYSHDISEWRFVEINRAVELVMHFPVEEWTGRRIAGILAPRYQHELLHYMHQIITQGSSRGVICALDAYGRERYLEYNSLLNRQASPPLVHGIARDITNHIFNRRRLEQLYEGVIAAMSQLVELRDPYTADHQKQVADLSEKIGRELGLDKKRLKLLRHAAMLHDIGKSTVPLEILIKPGRLSSVEWSLIALHPLMGKQILQEIPHSSELAEIVVQHHERLDGSGYPEGLAGKKILMEARIIAVADVFNAMTSHRPYRPALSQREALRELRDKAGVLYDTSVVESFLRFIV